MSVLDFLTTGPVQNAALGFLKKYMKNGGVKMAAIAPKEVADESGEDFDFHFYKEPMAIITQTDLAKYQSAVAKCIEHEIEF